MKVEFNVLCSMYLSMKNITVTIYSNVASCRKQIQIKLQEIIEAVTKVVIIYVKDMQH